MHHHAISRSFMFCITLLLLQPSGYVRAASLPFSQLWLHSSPCETIPLLLREALYACDSLNTRQQRDTLTIRILEDYCFRAHQVALECRYSLVAMMSLAARNAARNLLQSPNILLFRLSLKDIRAFLHEAQKYYDGTQ